jgi:NAD(P)-dependent dehydrogenase (short-subunit alcohol dehydrogenase family)
MANAVSKGRAGETYILGGENLTYTEFFTKVAATAGREPPKRVLPSRLILFGGALGSLYEKLSGKKALVNRTLAGLSLMGTYYSPQKAIEELDMPQTSIDAAIKEAYDGLIEYGHLEVRKTPQTFAGKVALITGASRGVGFATARALAERGARIVMTARGESRLRDSERKLREAGHEVIAVAGDVGDWEDARKMVDAAVSGFGRLDVVINNAGVSMRGDFVELSPQVCRDIERTNLTGCINVSKAAINHLVEWKGQLVFISSIAGLFGLPGASIYCATKKALTGFTESLRLELLPKGVNVGVVYLGFTEHDPEKRIIAADGELVLPDRPAHHSQADAAKLIVRMLERRKKQVVMTPVGVLGSVVYRISPGFIEKAVLWAKSSQLGIAKRFS